MALYEFNSSDFSKISNIKGQIIKDNLDIGNWKKLDEFMKDRNKNRSFIKSIIKKNTFNPLIPAHRHILKIPYIKFYEENDDNIFIFSRDNEKKIYCLYLFSRNLLEINKISVVYIFYDSNTILCPNFNDKFNKWTKIEL